MPDFPLRQVQSEAPFPFVSNVEHWVAQGMSPPNLTDQLLSVSSVPKGCASPIFVPKRMTATKLCILNGTVVGGYIQMFLADGPEGVLPTIIPASITLPVLVAGVSQWQELAIPTPIDLPPGSYYIGMACSLPTSTKFYAMALSAGTSYLDLLAIGGAFVTWSFPVIPGGAYWYDDQELRMIPCMAVRGF